MKIGHKEISRIRHPVSRCNLRSSDSSVNSVFSHSDVIAGVSPKSIIDCSFFEICLMSGRLYRFTWQHFLINDVTRFEVASGGRERLPVRNSVEKYAKEC